MNNAKRNVVVVGIKQEEIKVANLKDVKTTKDTWKDTDLTHRFPKYIYLDKFSEIERKEGFAIIISMDELPFKLENIYDFDYKCRKRFKKYELIIIYTKDKTQVVNPIPFSNVKIFYYYNILNLNTYLKRMYREYLISKEKNFSRIKNENIEKLRNYLIDKKTLKTHDVANDLNVSRKWVERYMKDMNSIYSNIGYNKDKRVWYVVK